MPVGSARGNSYQNNWNVTQAQSFTSYYENQLMASQQAHNPYAGHGNGYYQNPGQQPNFS
jgi:hypothetical protein